MVVLVVRTDWCQGAVIVVDKFLVTFAKQKKLKLGGHVGTETERLQPLNLVFEHLPWRMRYGFVSVMINDIAQYHGGTFKPWHISQRRQVRLHNVVTVA